MSLALADRDSPAAFLPVAATARSESNRKPNAVRVAEPDGASVCCMCAGLFAVGLLPLNALRPRRGDWSCALRVGLYAVADRSIAPLDVFMVAVLCGRDQGSGFVTNLSGRPPGDDAAGWTSCGLWCASVGPMRTSVAGSYFVAIRENRKPLGDIGHDHGSHRLVTPNIATPNYSQLPGFLVDLCSAKARPTTGAARSIRTGRRFGSRGGGWRCHCVVRHPFI